MKKLVIASKNLGKTRELKELLTPFNISIQSAIDLKLPEIEETGKTFEKNALLKAQSIFNATGVPTLADDSGLCVDALKGAPGVYTARYGGISKLLHEMVGVPTAQRGANFTCVLALVDSRGTAHTFEGKSFGTITTEPIGLNGFGYDPIFIPNTNPPENRTYAQMTSAEKAITSHRKKALEKLLEHLQNNEL